MVNPYLSHTVILAAMADGLERGLDPGPPQSHSSYDQPVADEDHDGLGFGRLPRTLGEALSELASDRVVRDALPPALYEAFAAGKIDEWERFCGTVTEWHRDMYLQAIP